VSKSTCAVQDCERAARTRGWCQKHYERWLKHGDPTKTLNPSRVDGTPEDRFWSKVHKSEGCWEWTDGKNRQGYGRFTEMFGTRLAHRIAWEMLVGSITQGMTLDHLCRNPGCVRPSHLEEATIKVNVLRGDGISAQNARKTHCKRGHEFTTENTLIRSKANGGSSRACRTCEHDRYIRNRSA